MDEIIAGGLERLKGLVAEELGSRLLPIRFLHDGGDLPGGLSCGLSRRGPGRVVHRRFVVRLGRRVLLFAPRDERCGGGSGNELPSVGSHGVGPTSM